MKKISFLSRPLFAVAAGAALALSLPATASAKPPEPITGTIDIKTGMTSVVLADEFEAALSELGVTTSKIIPGQYVRGQDTYRFPIRGGAFDLNANVAEVIHSGGVKLQTETTTVRLTDLILTLPAVPEEPETERCPVKNPSRRRSRRFRRSSP